MSEEKETNEEQDARLQSKHQTVIVIRRKWLIAQIVCFLTIFAMLIFIIQYVGYVDRKRELTEQERSQQLCGVFGRINKQYQQNPPPTETGKVFAEDIRQLVEDLDCPE